MLSKSGDRDFTDAKLKEAWAELRAAGAVLDRLIARHKNGEAVTMHEVDAARDRVRQARKRFINAMTSEGHLRERLN